MVDITGVNSQPNQPNRIENRSVSKSSASKSKESSTSGLAETELRYQQTRRRHIRLDDWCNLPVSARSTSRGGSQS